MGMKFQRMNYGMTAAADMPINDNITELHH